MDRIEREEERLKKIKERVTQLNNIARLKEKKRRIKISTEIGKLAIKAGIDKLDQNVLLGAFVEISQNSHVEENIQRWGKIASELLEKSEKNEKLAMIVTFDTEVDKSFKTLMKKYGLYWNEIRKEFFGYALKSEVEEVTRGKNCNIEVMPYD